MSDMLAPQAELAEFEQPTDVGTCVLSFLTLFLACGAAYRNFAVLCT